MARLLFQCSVVFLVFTARIGKSTGDGEDSTNYCLFNDPQLEKYATCVQTRAPDAAKNYIEQNMRQLGLLFWEVIRLVCRNSNDDSNLVLQGLQDELGDEVYQKSMKIQPTCISEALV